MRYPGEGGEAWTFALEHSVEQVRGIFYTTQDTLLLTCGGEGSFAGGGREERSG